jgi:hypothetical protein
LTIATRANIDNADKKFFITSLSGVAEWLRLQAIPKTNDGDAQSLLAITRRYMRIAAVGHSPKNDFRQLGNRGIVLIDTSRRLTEIVSKTNPPHHTANRQRGALLGILARFSFRTSRILCFQKRIFFFLEKGKIAISQIDHVRQETFFAELQFDANSPYFCRFSGFVVPFWRVSVRVDSSPCAWTIGKDFAGL